VVGARGVAGLSDRHAQGCGVQRHLGDERGSAATGGFNRTSQVAVTDQLIVTACPAWDLSNRPVTDCGADGSNIHLQKEVAEGGIGGRTLELDPKRLREHGMMAPGKTLQITHALAFAQDAEHRHQQQVPGRDSDALTHAGIGDDLEEADQVEIGCGSSDFRHREMMTAPIEVDGETRARETVAYFESALAHPLRRRPLEQRSRVSEACAKSRLRRGLGPRDLHHSRGRGLTFECYRRMIESVGHRSRWECREPARVGCRLSL
jgi:hypothetical protein